MDLAFSDHGLRHFLEVEQKVAQKGRYAIDISEAARSTLEVLKSLLKCFIPTDLSIDLHFRTAGIYPSDPLNE